ncbi:fumarylacetoacetate hydrolase family protein [Steroidobacter sp. S1-65]|uniref:Fumarylacetoacetate hydrolase family protein n=1 Tax=Steroidobacter gossypii TaxID=2805490 RepID=A0ABS1X4U8_9GAMM|nr:fumarylacetoacetate hydrolase family protein [Steroidobacter gossypii]MBM0108239.1 fumarylacetoacetate hydrolase family protein [Steroidobacter gossypii]
MKTSVARVLAPMSLICLVLSGCSLPQQRIVDEIVTSWREQRTLPNIDETLTIAEAYRVQTRSVRAKLHNANPAGFKAGLTSPPAQARFKTDSAVAGVLFKEGALQSSDTVSLRELRGLHVEVEIAMRIGTPIEEPLPDVAALRAHIDGIAAAIELPNLDYSQPQTLDAIDIVATNVAAASYIVGEFIPPRQRDPNAVDVKLACNGKQMFTGKGTDSLGDQWRAALWLVNKMLEQGWRIERGQILLTGALGRMLPAATGRCVASYHASDAPDGIPWASLEINVTE